MIVLILILSAVKKFTSHHIAVNEHIIYVPTQFRNVKIGQKPKLGRKPKAKKADALKKLD